MSAVLALLRRNLTERRRFILTLSAAAFALAAMVTALYPSIGIAYDEVLQDMPPALAAVLGDADFSTPAGFLQVELFSFLGPAISISAGVSVAARALAGSEQSGRLSLIAASPVRRSQIVTAAAAAAALAVLAATAGLLGGIVAGALLADVDLAGAHALAASVSTALLGLSVASISLAAGALSGDRGIAVVSGAMAAVVSYAIDAFFPLNATLKPLASLSLWHPFAANQPIVHGLDLANATVLAVVAALVAAVAYQAFERRDLAG